MLGELAIARNDADEMSDNNIVNEDKHNFITDSINWEDKSNQ